jgi:hypothetical protein
VRHYQLHAMVAVHVLVPETITKAVASTYWYFYKYCVAGKAVGLYSIDLD